MPDLNDALKRLEAFVSGLDFDTAITPSSFLSSDPFVLLSRDDINIFIRGEDSDTHSESIQLIFDAVSKREIMSRDSVERLVDDLIVESARIKREDPHNFEKLLKSQIRALRDSLNSDATEWEFYIPVIGLAPSELPYTVGPVDFYQADISGAQEYCRRLSELNPTSAARSAEQFPLVDFQSQYGDKAVGRVRVFAVDLTAAHRRAVKAVRRTIDCINFYSDWRQGTALRLKGDAEQGQRYDMAIRLAEPATASGSATRIAPWRALPIQQIAGRPGFSRISKLLSKTSLSRLEDRFLKATQWAGRARVEARIEESFLLFAVALETLMLKDSGNPTDLLYQLKLRTAHLLAARDLGSRKLTAKQIGDLYRTRSKIVHTGKFDVTDSELNLIDEYTRIALFIVLHQEPFCSMTEEEDFEAWFEARLLGATHASDEV